MHTRRPVQKIKENKSERNNKKKFKLFVLPLESLQNDCVSCVCYCFKDLIRLVVTRFNYARKIKWIFFTIDSVNRFITFSLNGSFDDENLISRLHLQPGNLYWFYIYFQNINFNLNSKNIIQFNHWLIFGLQYIIIYIIISVSVTHEIYVMQKKSRNKRKWLTISERFAILTEKKDL